MTEYCAVLTFADSSTTYEVYSRIKNADTLGVVAATIVERDADGTLKAAEGDDAVAGEATAGGSLIGLLVGVLGGPIGALLGLAVGGATGALIDADRMDKGDEAVATFAQAIPPGKNAILAETDEDDTHALDALVAQYNGTVQRRLADEVVDELEAQEQAAIEAGQAARKALREQHKQQRAQSRQERVAALKAKFHHSS